MSYPVSWMILTHSVMMSASAYTTGVSKHPVSVLRLRTIPTLRLNLECTYQRIEYLHDLVELNFETWSQFNGIQYSHLPLPL